jgi:hypothetical protein
LDAHLCQQSTVSDTLNDCAAENVTQLQATGYDEIVVERPDEGKC